MLIPKEQLVRLEFATMRQADQALPYAVALLTGDLTAAQRR